MSTETAVTYFSSGVRCAALLLEPDGPSPANGRAAVVLCHGFRGIKEWALPDFARLFADAGVIALAIDYRGFGESDGERGRLVPDEQVQDIRAALSWLEGRPGVDADRLALYGTSFGGANVVQAAALDPRVRAVVCQVGIGDIARAWPDARRRFAERIAADRITRARTGVSERIDPGAVLDNPQSNEAFARMEQRFPQLRVTFPLEALERIFEFRPEERVAQIAPRAALFIGATTDDAVPVSETTSLFEHAGEPKRIEIFDITHYEIYDTPWQEQAVDLALGWFDEHCAPRLGTSAEPNLFTLTHGDDT